MPSPLDTWRAWAAADAEARIPGLGAMLDGLAASLARLRSVDWVAELQKSHGSRQDAQR